MSKTSFTTLVGIDLPLIQAPMAGVQGAEMTVAVSNAGGLGSLPCAMLSLDDLRAGLSAVSRGTNRPYNVNFFTHAVPQPDRAREEAWARALRPYYAELGVPQPAPPVSPTRTPFSAEVLDVVAAFRPPVISFHFGLPPRDLLATVRSWGTKVLSSATTVDEARWLEAHGVDAIIAQGLEAGGHRGHFLSDDLTLQMGTLALVAQIARAVRVPVVAAGGIADAGGVASALALGAAAAQVGTAYLRCSEATTSVLHREALASPAAVHTAVTNVFTGRPARSIVNRLVREVGPMSALAPDFPLAAGAIAPLRASAEAQGSTDFSALWCGQNASGCRDVSAAVLTRSLAGEFA